MAALPGGTATVLPRGFGDFPIRMAKMSIAAVVSGGLFTDRADVLYSLAAVITCYFVGTVWLAQPCQNRQGFLLVCKE